MGGLLVDTRRKGFVALNNIDMSCLAGILLKILLDKSNRKINMAFARHDMSSPPQCVEIHVL